MQRGFLGKNVVWDPLKGRDGCFLSRNKRHILHCFAGLTDTWRSAIGSFLIFLNQTRKKEKKKKTQVEYLR